MCQIYTLPLDQAGREGKNGVGGRGGGGGEAGRPWGMNRAPEMASVPSALAMASAMRGGPGGRAAGVVQFRCQLSMRTVVAHEIPPIVIVRPSRKCAPAAVTTVPAAGPSVGEMDEMSGNGPTRQRSGSKKLGQETSVELGE